MRGINIDMLPVCGSKDFQQPKAVHRFKMILLFWFYVFFRKELRNMKSKKKVEQMSIYDTKIAGSITYLD